MRASKLACNFWKHNACVCNGLMIVPGSLEDRHAMLKKHGNDSLLKFNVQILEWLNINCVVYEMVLFASKRVIGPLQLSRHVTYFS